MAGTAVLLWLLVGFILYPALRTLEVSLVDNGSLFLGHYLHFFTSTSTLIPLRNSLILGLLTVVVCGTIGTALAFAVHFFVFPWKTIIDKLLLLPIMLPGIIIVFAFVQLYGESGLVTKSVQTALGLETVPFRFSGLPGILFVHAYTQYVYFYISVSIAIRHIDRSVIESARSLGASKRRIFLSIILPFLKPALIASATITFMSGLGSFTAPSIIGGGFKVLTTQILLAKANNYMALAAAQVVVLAALSLLFFLIFGRLEKQSRFVPALKSAPLEAVHIRNPLLNGMLLLIAFLLIVTILLPVLAIVVLSFVKPGTWMVSIYPEAFSLDNYLTLFTRTRRFQPFLNSTVMALLAGLLALIIAVPSSYLIVKTRSRARWLVEVLLVLPWAMPCSAIAINCINAFNRPSVFAFNQVLVGTAILLPLGYGIRSIPIMVKATNVSFHNLNDTLLDASRSLGAGTAHTFARVVVPVIAPGLLAGFLLVFLRSIGDYSISVFLYTAANRPVSIAMVNSIFEYNIGEAMAYGSLLILLAILITLAISRRFSQL